MPRLRQSEGLATCLPGRGHLYVCRLREGNFSHRRHNHASLTSPLSVVLGSLSDGDAFQRHEHLITRRGFLRVLGIAALSGFSLGGYAFGIEPHRLRVQRYSVVPPRWPHGLSLRIAALADIHACEPWMTVDRIRGIVDATNSLGADIIVLLGDYGAGHHWVTRWVESKEWSEALSGLRAPLGVHAVLGNHDWWEDRLRRKVVPDRCLVAWRWNASASPSTRTMSPNCKRTGKLSGSQAWVINLRCCLVAGGGASGGRVSMICLRHCPKLPTMLLLFSWRTSRIFFPTCLIASH